VVEAGVESDGYFVGLDVGVVAGDGDCTLEGTSAGSDGSCDSS
jgi:hypothetical protein